VFKGNFRRSKSASHYTIDSIKYSIYWKSGLTSVRVQGKCPLFASAYDKRDYKIVTVS